MKSNRIIRSLALASLVSVALYVARALTFSSTEFWYLNWNLLLAWVPLIFSYMLVRHCITGFWVSTKGILLTILWLLFLPNSFYLATDFIHLQRSTSESLLFDIVLLLSYTFNGFIVGYLSVYSVHQLLLRRMSRKKSHLLVAGVFLLCSFAIYLGRYLRWNSWDIIFNPAGILFDVSDRFLNPADHEQTFWTTALFFVLISSVYIVLWSLLREVQLASVSKAARQPALPRRGRAR